MAQRIYPLRLSSRDRVLFGRAARAENKTMAQWLREAARERAGKPQKRRAACLDYPEWPLSEAAERDKDYLRRKFKGHL